jgi:rfaE bifunctional protein nucleotidyltransferase chain/domain
MGLIVPREAFAALRDSLPDQTRLVFTNGCFDLLHVGHLRLLSHARSLGDALVVGLNSDASVRQLKGPRRPLVPQEERAAVLAALPTVDFVIIFDETLPNETVRAVRPAIHVKGGDYDVEQMPETPVVRALGGEVVIVPLVEGHSTTNLLERIGRHAE